MKKFGFLLLMSLLAIAGYGQEAAQAENVQSSIVRNHDRYTVDGVTYINSTEFRGYLKNTNPELFAQYNKGYKLSMVGWGLFAFGMVTIPVGLPWLLRTQVGPVVFPLQASIGFVSLVAGTTMLGVGYHRMHKSVDVYNVSHSSAAPQTYWSIKTSGNGIGIAYNF